MIQTTRKEKIEVVETFKKVFPKTLIKDLQEHERICPVCHGLGIRIEDNIYGIEGDTSEAGRRKMFPYKKQSLSFCRSCYNGVQELCEFCGEPYKQPGYRHCDCEGFKKNEGEKRITKWEEIVAKAKEVQESNVDTMLYCKEFNRFYNNTDEFLGSYFVGNTIKPDRLWVTERVEIKIDETGIIKNTCDEFEDTGENCDYKSLQKLLDDWYKDQDGTTTYYPCYKEYVKIDWSKYGNE